MATASLQSALTLHLLAVSAVTHPSSASASSSSCQLADWTGDGLAAGGGRRVTLQRDNWNSHFLLTSAIKIVRHTLASVLG